MFETNGLLQQMRSDIITRKLTPGKKVTEFELADEYGVNRSRMRNLLIELESEGLVKIHPNGTKEIVGFDRDDAYNLCELREYIETTALKRIFGGRSLDYAPLTGILTQIEACKSDGTGDLSLNDVMFHRAIIELAANRYILGAYDTIMPTLYTLFTITTKDKSNVQTPEEFYSRHIDLLVSIINRKKEECFALFRKHHENALAKALRALELI